MSNPSYLCLLLCIGLFLPTHQISSIASRRCILSGLCIAVVRLNCPLKCLHNRESWKGLRSAIRHRSMPPRREEQQSLLRWDSSDLSVRWMGVPSRSAIACPLCAVRVRRNGSSCGLECVITVNRRMTLASNEK